MTHAAQPFARVEPASGPGDAAVVVGWREQDGTERVVFRMPLKTAIRSLFDQLKIAPMLLPSGIVAIDAEALSDREVASLMTDGGLPEIALSALVRSMLDEIAQTPDASDAKDLEHLADDLEGAARDIRAALSRLKSAK
jgi:hypothetical protein